MFKYISSRNIAEPHNTCNFYVELPCVCPRCDVSLIPEVLSGHHIETSSAIHLDVLFFCPKCHQCFIGTYIQILEYWAKESKFSLAYCLPENHHVSPFSANISSTSPSFVKIYNQSELAEENGLNEICGIGYRKSLEFLVKDYAIKLHPENEESIKSMPLSPCIKKFIDNPKIQTLAVASAWIGNDETHYIRKHEDYSLQQLKAFIVAIIAYIDYEAEVEAAATLLAKE